MQTTQQNNEARIAIEAGFAWDAQDAYLFDIDGTLLRSRDRVHLDTLPASVQRVMGFEVSLAGVSLPGNTDTAILREACAQAGIPAEVLEPQMAAILEGHVRKTWRNRRNELDLILMPGVEETLRAPGRAAARLLGVATGNLEMIGWIKMEQRGAARVVPLRRLQRSLPCSLRADWPGGEEGARAGGGSTRASAW